MSKVDRDCTSQCRSKLQATELLSVLTKRIITDIEICSYLNYKCSNCGVIVDHIGRSALHFAVSTGRKDVAEWLIRSKNAQINLRDFESGYSPLHRSVFYGKINAAVSLIQLGAQTNIYDNNDLSPLDHALKDRIFPLEWNAGMPCQVYVWGSNTNYTLGTGSQHSRNFPELLESFYRKFGGVSIRGVGLSKFHLVLCSRDGRVFSCGHGQGGRLGLGGENTVLEPEEVRFAQGGNKEFICKEVAIGRDHSLFLSESGQVWSCGLNTNHVLGLRPPPPQVVTPRPLTDLKHPIDGICCSRFHSVAWSQNGVYTWGLHAGQLGHDKGPRTQVSPKAVTYFSAPNMEIVTVATSDGAVVVTTKKGDVYILHEYQCRKIASRQINIIKTVVVGGHLDPKSSTEIQSKQDSNELRVVILTSVGNILIWQESFPQLTRCIYNLNRSLVVKDIALNKFGLLFTTTDGEVFKGELKPRKKKSNPNSQNSQKQFNEFLEKDDCQIVKISKVPNIHRGVKIQSDPKGGNFAVLQVDPSFNLRCVPQISEGTIQNDLLSLLKNSDDSDSVHDVTFKIGTKLFPLHRYIIAQKSPFLTTLLDSHNSDSPVELTNVDPVIFQQILLYIYTGSCDLLKVSECPDFLKILTTKSKIITTGPNIEELNENISAFEHYKVNKNLKNTKSQNLAPSDPVRLLQETAKRFGLKNLCKKLEGLCYVDGYIERKSGKFDFSSETVIFDRGVKMHDVVIKCSNGKEILAHKCILAARLEYFNNIFAVRWNLNSSRNQISLPISTTLLEPIIDFLYTDDVKVQNSSIDFISNLLVIADQLFIDRLKEFCEVSLSQNLTLKNCNQMLQFAGTYNAPQLKTCCMEYICLNLSAVLEVRSLEGLEDEILTDLTNFYCEWNDNMSKRVITPFSDAPSDETVKAISETYPIEDTTEAQSPKSSEKKKKPRSGRKNSERGVKNKEFPDIDPKIQFPDTPSNSNQLLGQDSQIITIRTGSCGLNSQKESKWTKIEEKSEKIVKARLKAAQLAQETNLDLSDNFTALVKKGLSSPSQKKFSGPKFSNFPDLSNPSSSHVRNEPNFDYQAQNSPKTQRIFSPQSPHTPQTPQSPRNVDFGSPKSPIYNIPILKVKKISQKQRKKLAFDSASIANELGVVNQRASDFSTIGSPAETPVKNPWKKIEVVASVEEREEVENFATIVTDEKRLKENWAKMKTKPLTLTQMEDRAIEELLRFYNAEECAEECITIQRVETAQYTMPIWVQNSKK